MLNIAAVTVLYYPPANVSHNINSYLNQIEKLYVIDNTPEVKSYKFNNSKIIYIKNNQNLGIAYALNLAAEFAIKENYKYLLMMDQDSFANENFVEKLMNGFNYNKNVALVSPLIIHKNNQHLKENKNQFSRIDVAMTSGSILKIDVYREVGKFLNEFFIDYVDNEYCLRLKSKNYEVIQVNSAELLHELGSAIPSNFLFQKVYPTNHPPLRLFYRSRNRLFVYKKYFLKYPNYVLNDILIWIKEILKIILYEKSKKEKIKMSLRGVIYFIRNKFGKYE